VGAVTFSLDPPLVAALQSALPLSVLLETGTFKGDTVSALESFFDKVVSIELSEALYADAINRFADCTHVRILQGNSGDKLRELRSELQDVGVLYWLDAHWCIATNTAGELSECPLLDELQAIGKLNNKSVVLIDDARLFLAPPLAPHEITHWPSFHQVLTCLLAMSADHELIVINDVIAFFPKQARAAVQAYAQSCGTDWLVATNCLKENGTFVQQLEKKEAVIKEKDQAILEKEQHIHELSKILGIYRAIFSIPVLGQMLQILNRIAIIIRPRLGVLDQYPPRALTRQLTKLEAKVDAVLSPKISIVTPSYQQGMFIERTLNSILNQEYKNLEYFIQDGGSKDNTVEVIQRYEKKLTGWVSEEDGGQSQAINRGFKNASGEIMAWLNSDDLLLPDTLAIVADYFSHHPNVDVVYGNRLLIDENDMEIGRWIMPGHDGKVLSWVDYVPQETMFWRRRIWDKVGGGVDETFRFAMDWDLLVRFREAGANFAHIPYFLGAFRIHDRQKTSAAINEIGFQEMDRIRERLLGRVPSKKEVRKAVTPFLLKHVFIDKIYGLKTRLGRRP
jgi:glycosyltransferase involved in cell wall biosynthesis